MVEFEADDALAAAAVAAALNTHVEQVVICTPDKDLAQCVRGTRIIQLNRRTRTTNDEAAIRQKFGVSPESIPDYLALVGDAADGYPGLAGWGAKSSAAVLAKFIHLESIPKDCREWRVNAANPSALADILCREWTTQYCSVSSPHSELTSPSLMMWISYVGRGRHLRSKRSQPGWM